jgi:predicted Zn-dependent protease
VTPDDVTPKRRRRPFLPLGIDVLEIDPEPLHPLLRPLLADLDGLDHGAVSEWASVVHHVQREQPDDPFAPVMEAHALFLMEHPEVALQRVDAAPDDERTRVWRTAIASSALLELNQPEAALARLEAAPRDPVLLYEKGRALSKLSKPGQARSAAVEACEGGLRTACVTVLAFELRKDHRQERRRGKAKSASRGPTAPARKLQPVPGPAGDR